MAFPSVLAFSLLLTLPENSGSLRGEELLKDLVAQQDSAPGMMTDLRFFDSEGPLLFGMIILSTDKERVKVYCKDVDPMLRDRSREELHAAIKGNGDDLSAMRAYQCHIYEDIHRAFEWYTALFPSAIKGLESTTQENVP